MSAIQNLIELPAARLTTSSQLRSAMVGNPADGYAVVTLIPSFSSFRTYARTIVPTPSSAGDSVYTVLNTAGHTPCARLGRSR